MPWFWGGSNGKNDKDGDQDEDDDYSSYEDDDDDEEENDYDSGEYTDDDDDDDDDPEESSPSHPNDNGAGPTSSGGRSPSAAPRLDGGSSSTKDGLETTTTMTTTIVDAEVERPLHPTSPPTTALAGNGHGKSSSGDILGKSHHSSEFTLDDDASLIESIGWQSKDDRNLESSHSYSEEEEEDYNKDDNDNAVIGVKGARIEGMEKVVQATHVNGAEPPPLAVTISLSEDKSRILSKDNNHDDDSGEEEEDVPTTFWEKQSLLVLAAEHDRVDILRGILSDDDGDRPRLMDSGIPPLHLAIHFGSVNTTQTLLRMGADPSIRPNVALVKKQAKEAPEGQTVDIPKIERFDGVTAWELAFGNEAYQEQQQSRSATKWSMFNSPLSKVPARSVEVPFFAPTIRSISPIALLICTRSSTALVALALNI